MGAFLRRGCALFLALALLAAAEAQAGCPAMRPVNVNIKVDTCRFYDAAADAALRGKVEAYFHDGWDNKSPAELAERRAETLRRNTGLILGGTAAAGSRLDEFFLRTSDPAGCDAFTPATSYEFTQHATCVMIFFEAPVDKVVTFPASAPEPAAVPSAELKRPE